MNETSAEIKIEKPEESDSSRVEGVDLEDTDGFDVRKSTFFYTNGKNLVEEWLKTVNQEQADIIIEQIILKLKQDFKSFNENRDATEEEITVKIAEYENHAAYMGLMDTNNLFVRLRKSFIEHKITLSKKIDQKDKEGEKTKESIIINNLEELSVFLTEKLPLMSKDELHEKGYDIFNQIVDTLERAFQGVKKGNRETIRNFVAVVSTLWKPLLIYLKPGELENGGKKKLIEDICKEFGKLNRSLENKLSKLDKEEASLVEFDDIQAGPQVEKPISRAIRIKKRGEATDSQREIPENIEIKSLGEMTTFLTEEILVTDFSKIKGYTLMQDISKILLNEYNSLRSKKIEDIVDFEQKILKITIFLNEQFGFQNSKTVGHKIPKEVEKIEFLQELRGEFIHLAYHLKIIGAEKLQETERGEKEGKIKDEAKKKERKQAAKQVKNPPKTKNTGGTVPTKSTDPARGEKEEYSEINIVNESDREIPENITADTAFNSWMDRLLKKKYVGEKHTMTEWYQIYTEQKEKIDKVQEALKTALTDKNFADRIFANLKNPEEKIQAEKMKIEQLEWEMLINKDGAARIETILSSYENIKKLDKEKKELETKKELLQRALLGAKDLEPNMVYEALYRDEAEIKKISELEGFLKDMKYNYMNYQGSVKKEKIDGSMENMFKLFRNTRGKTEYKDEKIGWWTILKAKVSERIREKPIMSVDKFAFSRSIKALRKAELVETEGVGKEKASDNMNKLIVFVDRIKSIVKNKKMSVEEAVRAVDKPEAEALFRKIYMQHIQNITEHPETQREARGKHIVDKTYASIEEKINDTESVRQDFENKFHTGILGENDELTEFTNEVKTELAGEKLKNISASIRDIIDKKEFNIQKLDELSQEFGDIVPTDALALEYKKVSLQLSQAEITFIVNRKELSSAKNSQKQYEALFENNKISNKEKKECADAILALLKAKLNKGKNNFSENLKLKQSIRYFEEKSEAFKA